MDQKLYSRSIDIILKNQSIWGSYVASPAFPTYHYCWLRDGSFIAYAMDRAGQHESAASFYNWVASTIRRYAWKVDDVERSLCEGREIGRDLILHTRYTLDGFEGTIDKTWGNFQIDGYGTWLWGLAYHVRQTGNYDMLEELEDSIKTTVRYLALTWKLPNYDCWEEHPEYIHPYSLACAYGGLHAIASLVDERKFSAFNIDTTVLAHEIRNFILRYGVADGKLIKHIWPPRGDEPAKPVAHSAVDASLLGMSFPFNVLDLEDPLMAATVEEIEAKLWRQAGGVYRYKADVYYGGGEWILLTAWLGLHFLHLGQKEKAMEILNWIENKADHEGNLPEQVSDHLLTPRHFESWLNKWGPVASPLLWSHAMYIVLVNAIHEGPSK